MKIQNALSINFITSSIWASASCLILAFVIRDDQIGPIGLGISFLYTALLTYVGYKKERPLSLLAGYLGACIFVVLSLLMVWYVINLRDLDLPKKIFLVMSGGILAINLSTLGLVLLNRIKR